MYKLKVIIYFVAIIVIIAGVVALNSNTSYAQKYPPPSCPPKPTSPYLNCSDICDCSDPTDIQPCQIGDNIYRWCHAASCGFCQY